MNLQQCLHMADRNNVELQERYWSERESRLRWLQAQTNMLPNINMGSNWNHYRGRSINPTTNTYIERRNNSLRMNLGGSVDVFDSFRKFLQAKKSKVDWKGSQYSRESQRILVFLEVMDVYLDVLLQEAILGVREQWLDVLRSRQRELEGRRAVGDLSDYEVASGKVDVLARESDILQAENALRNAQRRLHFLLGVPSEVAIVLEQDKEEDIQEEADQLPPLEDLYTQALAYDPNVRSQVLREQSASLNMSISRRRRYPVLSLSGSMSSSYASANDQPFPITDGTRREVIRPIGFLESDPQEVVSQRVLVPNVIGTDPSYTVLEQLEDNIAYNIGFRLSVPVFDRWEKRRDLQYKRIDWARAKLGLQNAKNQLRNYVETAYNDIQTSLQLQEVARVSYDAAQIAYDLATKRYTLGDMKLRDYQQEGVLYYEKKTKLLQETYALLFRLRVIDFYLGTWQEKYKL